MVATVGPLAEVTCVRRESFFVSGPDGDLTAGGTQGFYVRDTRFLDRFEVAIDGRDLRALSGGSVAADRAVFHGFVPRDVDREVDATLLVTRRRVVDGGLHEEVILANASTEPEELTLVLRLGTDFAYIFDVKHGRELPHVPGQLEESTLTYQRPDGVERTSCRLAVDESPCVASVERAGGTTVASVRVTVPARGHTTLAVDVTITDVYGEVRPGRDCRDFDHTAPPPRPAIVLPEIDSSDVRLRRLIRQSLQDLEGLVLHDPESPEDRFAAAGSPWFLTLFGRDSLWAAFMALPFDPGLAAGTLRALARRQGTRLDADTEQAPGKILHEVRRGALAHRGDLPPNYYGSVDATPLFVILAHEAWRWGVDETVIARLLPNVEAALAWMTGHGDPDGDGFLEYVRPEGRGLANQGWKDSGDGIRFADGAVATAPMALAEVQGYAYAAARAGASLLDHFGHPGGTVWRDWAANLAARFRERFWVSDASGRYPAVALDRDKRPVDGVASNMGHLLFTGILDTEETALVARRLTDDDMDAGWGLRTLSAAAGGYNPLSYHCGSIWPHDTAIAAFGLARTGHAIQAWRLIRGLLDAAPTFDYRLPELFAGVSARENPRPVPYATACRPQAWAAAGVLLTVRAILGLEADVPAGVLHASPLPDGGLDTLDLRGLPLGRGSLDLRLHDGVVDAGIRGADVAMSASTS